MKSTNTRKEGETVSTKDSKLSLHLLQITAVGGYISIRVVTVRTSNRLIDNIVPNCY